MKYKWLAIYQHGNTIGNMPLETEEPEFGMGGIEQFQDVITEQIYKSLSTPVKDQRKAVIIDIIPLPIKHHTKAKKGKK